EGKAKRKDFLVISFFQSINKKKKSEGKKEKYLLDLSCYSLKDLKQIIKVITEKNSNIRITKELNDYLNGR
ncbi:MAG TPA: hypothetical protein DG753_08635, partial [Clostridium sp.]|nr:hypothetical protein [Clostridium sp.]